MAWINLATATIQTDEAMVDKEGNPLHEAAVYEGNIIVCHPDLVEKVREAQQLFFTESVKSEESDKESKLLNMEDYKNE